MSQPKSRPLMVTKDPTEMIIAAIDSLKGRKARPDEVRICNHVERKFGLSKGETVKAIQEAVADGTILKVKYKDSVSYRNPAKFSKLMHNHVMRFDGQVQNTPVEIMKKVLRQLRSLTRSISSGASVRDITRTLHDHSQLLNYDEPLIARVLQRALEMGSAALLPSGNYILSGGKRIVPRKTDPDQSASTSKLLNADDFLIEENLDVNQLCDTIKDDDSQMLCEETPSPRSISDGASSSLNGSTTISRKKSTPVVKRARQLSKRKKFKKSLGPDFVESSELGLQYLREAYEPKCDFCQGTASCNRKGIKEELLACKDCSAKAHPSCMDYSKQLAERSRRSPWQCMDCKTCAVCEDSGDGGSMLVCDMCDKGYHMNCHIPQVKDKPNGINENDKNSLVSKRVNKFVLSGKWACNDCLECVSKNGSMITNTNNDTLTPNCTNNGQYDALSVRDKIAQHIKNSIKLASNKKPIALDIIVPIPKPTMTGPFAGYPDVIPNPTSWTPETVGSFIEYIGFPQHSHLFKEQQIDGCTLLLMRRTDVLSGFEFKLGPALKIYSHIMRLQKYE